MTSNLALGVLSLSQSLELSLLIKVTIVLAAGLVVQRLARRARASVRHLLLAATFLAALWLPLAALVAPSIAIRVPVDVGIASGMAPQAAPLPPAHPAPSPSVSDGDVPTPVLQSFSLSWLAVVRIVWIAGSIYVLGGLAFALYRLSRLRRSALPWAEMREPLRSLAADAGVSRQVDIVVHEDVASPITFATRHAVIVLPVDARGWDQADLRRTLVHELEHVRRGDWLLQTTARVVCGAWWFVPLVWVAWRRLSLEAERACDDAVVAREEGMAYAEQLVSLAERLSVARSQPTLGMANRSDLSARVTSVLDTTLARGRAGWAAIGGAALVAALLVVSVAPLQAVPVTSSSAAAAVVTTDQNRLQWMLDRGLYEASLDGDVAGVGELLQAGANVNAAVAGDGSPLIAAVRSGRLEVVQLLLDRGGDPNLGVAGDGNPLIAGASEGRLEIVRLLLDRGAKPDVIVRGDGSALIAAAAEGHLDVVTLLLDRGASIDLAVDGDENPLIRAADEGRLAVVQALVRRGANVNARVWADAGFGRQTGEWRTPLGMARKNRHVDVVEFLRSVGAQE